MYRIWNSLTRGFRARPPASPSQASSPCNDENENIQHLNETESYLHATSHLIQFYNNREKEKSGRNRTNDSSQFFQNTADSMAYGAASGFLISQVVRYFCNISQKIFEENDKQSFKAKIYSKAETTMVHPQFFTGKPILPKITSVSKICSTVHAAGGNEDQNYLSSKNIKVDPVCLKASAKKAIVPDDDLEKFLLETKHCVGMTYNIQGIDNYNAGNYRDAFHYFKLGSEGGSKQAQYNLAICYHLGKGTKKDIKKAKKEYSRASRQGHQIAQYNLALLLLEEKSTISMQSALFLLEKSAESGLVQAQSLVGSYFAQEGVNHNMKKAVRMFQLASDQEDPLSTFHLAQCYEHGLGGLKVGTDQAYYFYSVAARLGHVEAHYKMAMILLSGSLEKGRNEILAMEILNKAKELGHEKSSQKYEELKAATLKKTVHFSNNDSQQSTSSSLLPAAEAVEASQKLFCKLYPCKLPMHRERILSNASNFFKLTMPFNPYQYTNSMHRVTSWPWLKISNQRLVSPHEETK